MNTKLIKDEKLYYLENGKVVFTPEHHMARGHCCGSKCRHCPYEPKYIKGNTKIEESFFSLNNFELSNFNKRFFSNINI